ncbi:MAG: hypothetical protein MI861_28800, partial [Pirellulales bacterium]|nr:hypothetical protein [Pirellulales bacterium]
IAAPTGNGGIDPPPVPVPDLQPPPPTVDPGGPNDGVDVPPPSDGEVLVGLDQQIDTPDRGIDPLRLAFPFLFDDEPSEPAEAGKLEPRWHDRWNGLPIEGSLDDVFMGNAESSRSDTRGWDQDLDSDDEDDDLVERFWREFDLELLGQEDRVSPLQLRFRLYPLRLSETAEQPGDRRSSSDPEQNAAGVPSVLDRGLVDISPWLLDPRYHSWTKPQRSPLPAWTRQDEIPDRVAEAVWKPQADVVLGLRLERVDGNHGDAPEMQMESLRQIKRRRLDDVDASTAVPGSDASGGSDVSEGSDAFVNEQDQSDPQS